MRSRLRASGLLRLCGFAAIALAAQEPTFRSSSYLVIAPVTVTRPDGKPAEGLAPSDFILLDKGQPVRFDADGYIPPISLVVAVENSDLAAPALNKLRGFGPLIEPLLTGERGQAAVIAYDSAVQVIEGLTKDAPALKRAFAGLKSRGSHNGRMLDAVQAAAGLLHEAPVDSRRVLLLIGESKDRGSEAKLADVLTQVQHENILIYGLNYSPFLTPWTTKASDMPVVPCCNLLESLAEIGRAGKEKTADVLARETGGRTLGFLTRGGMEQAVTRIGEELQGQYLLSFSATGEPGQYHPIEVRLRKAGDLKVRTRPGYWLVP